MPVPRPRPSPILLLGPAQPRAGLGYVAMPFKDKPISKCNYRKGRVHVRCARRDQYRSDWPQGRAPLLPAGGTGQDGTCIVLLHLVMSLVGTSRGTKCSASCNKAYQYGRLSLGLLLTTLGSK